MLKRALSCYTCLAALMVGCVGNLPQGGDASVPPETAAAKTEGISQRTPYAPPETPVESRATSVPKTPPNEPARPGTNGSGVQQLITVQQPPVSARDSLKPIQKELKPLTEGFRQMPEKSGSAALRLGKKPIQ